MAEKSKQKEMPKDVTRPNILSVQEESFEETEGKRYMEELKHDIPLEHSIQSPQLGTVFKSTEMIATDEISSCTAEDDCSKAGDNVLEKDIITKYPDNISVYRTGEQKVKEFEDCDIESSHDDVPQVIDTLIQSHTLFRTKVDVSNDNVLSTDSVNVPIDMDTCESDSHPIIEQCVNDIVETVTYCINKVPCLVTSNTEIPKKFVEETIQLPSGQIEIATHETVPFETVTISREEIKSDATDNRILKIHNQTFKISECSLSDELKIKQLKKALKDIDLLSSCTEEIGRMNEIFKTEIIKMLSELMIIRRSARYVHENLTVLEDLPACTILFHATDKLPQSKVNVYEFGANLLKDLTKLFRNLKDLLRRLNEFRLKFIDLSETFAVNPFELHVGELKNNVLDAAFSAAINIYNVYFDNDSWEILHEQFVSEHEALQSVGAEFDALITKLGAHYGEH